MNQTTELEELIQAFAVTRRQAEPPSAILVRRTTERSKQRVKHLYLLDLVATILVTEATSDTAAAAMMIKSHPLTGEDRNTTLEFLIAKNRPCTEREQRYISSFVEKVNRLRLLDNADERSECLGQIYYDIVRACWAKIVRRLKKILKESDALAQLHQDPWVDPAKKDLDRFLKNTIPASGMTWPGSWNTLLEQWISNARNVVDRTQAKPHLVTVKDLAAVIGVARDITRTRGLRLVFQSAVLERRVRKLGMYYEVIEVIETWMKRAPYRGYNVRVHEVRPYGSFIYQYYVHVLLITLQIPLDYPPTTIQMTRSPLDIINEVGARNNVDSEPITLQDIEHILPDIATELVKVGAVRQTVHCECRLALALQARHIRPIEIGLSKGSCYLCAEFLAALSGSSASIFVTNSHDKTYGGWAFPLPLSHPEASRIYTYMRECLQKQIQALQQFVQERRLSDSLPASEPSDEDDDSPERRRRISPRSPT